MAITVTDRGTFQSAAGGGTLDLAVDVTSSSFTVAAGAILVIGTFINANNQSAATDDVSFTVTDTIGDTGGGSWTATGASCTRGNVINGAYIERVQLFYRVIGTSPGSSKTVSFHSNYTGGVGTTTNDGWQGAHLWEASGQHATPIGLTSSPSAAQNVSTWPMDFGSTPASDSACFSVIHDDNTASTNVFTEPSGWTESDEQDQTTWGAASAWAYKIGSVVQTPTWTTHAGAAERILGCAVEIKAAAAAGFDPPDLHPYPQLNVYRM